MPLAFGLLRTRQFHGAAQARWSDAPMQTFYGVEVTPGKTSAFVPPPIDAQLHLSQVRSVLFLTYYSLPKDDILAVAQ